MTVKNRKCIRRLSVRSLWASRKRNYIAVCAIALTTLLFTSLFTIAMSINKSYEEEQFRQCGSYSHGSFKDVTKEQQDAITAHPKVKETGVRKVIGICSDGVFTKAYAEVSFMDENCTKWSYAIPDVGRMPESGNEVSMDTAALELLGIEPELGAQIPLSYYISNRTQTADRKSDTFTLVGYWEYDELMPCHYINVSEEYASEIEEACVSGEMEPFRADLYVMMASGINIRGQMEQVDTDLGYTWDSHEGENSVRIGVNWGYTSSQLGESFDPEMLVAIVAFLLLIIFTGYLIIYNIFQISVSGDIRFYGLLKTIGTTPRQLRRIIRQQALLLCTAGIPIGLLLGYVVGTVLMPVVTQGTSIEGNGIKISSSPVIFIGSTIFALLTVLLSCSRPGRIAGKVSPVEAAKYTEVTGVKKKHRASRGARVHHMAFANLGRNKVKTVLVVVSLSLSVTLLNMLCSFVRGFNLEKYVSAHTCADFIVSSPDYFRYTSSGNFITEETIRELESNTHRSLSGCAYTVEGPEPLTEIDGDTWKKMTAPFVGEAAAEEATESSRENGITRQICQIEGLDEELFEKVQVADGSLDPLFDQDRHAIALDVMVDDYGNIINPDIYPTVGESLSVIYVEEGWYIDSRTGEMCDDTTPEEYIEYHTEKAHTVEYEVCALVSVPYSMSHRYSTLGYAAVLPVDALRADRGDSHAVIPMLYLFDTPDPEAEASAESYLSDLTSDAQSPLMYESKATIRESFQEFRHTFLITGGVCVFIIGLVGILNFFNAIMTGILSRRREFAVLQAVGMTGRQLKSMLIYEGLFYALSSVGIALLLSLALNPPAGRLLGGMFWFFEYRFTIAPVFLMIPVFSLLGWLIPAALYGQAARQSIVDRLRDAA